MSICCQIYDSNSIRLRYDHCLVCHSFSKRLMLSAKRNCLLWLSCVGVLPQLMLILLVMVDNAVIAVNVEVDMRAVDQSVASPRSVMPFWQCL